MEDGVHLFRNLLVDLEAGRYHEQMRAESLGHHYRLSRMNTIPAGFVAGCRDHASLSVEAHGDGYSAPFRMVSLLNGGKVGIHVDMDNLSHVFLKNICKDSKNARKNLQK